MREDKKNDAAELSSMYCTEDLLNKVGGNLFQLVRVAAKRALELDEGKPPLISDPSEKVTTTALQEIIKGKVVFKKKN